MEQETITQLQQFRVELYHTFTRRADAVFELIDALSGDTQARSPAELSLSGSFRRQYASVYDGVDGWQFDGAAVKELLLQVAPGAECDGFRLIGIDHTPKPRLYAPKVADRSCVHQSTPIKGNKPITIGHDYSFIGQIDVTRSDTWLAALDVQRIASRWTAVEVGLSQLIELAQRCQDWVVIAGDCEYSIPLTVACLAQVEHLSGVFRLRSNRKLYGKPPPYAGFGHPRWHGSLFRLNDARTWWTPDEERSWTETDAQGHTWTIRLRRWRDLHFREARRFWFDVVQVEVTDQQGQPRFRRPWWLLVCGRRSLSLADCRAIYQRRPVMEHFNRFQKQRLLFSAAQFSDTQHEEKFVWVGTLAYAQLYLARMDVERSVRPWERYKPLRAAHQAATPAQARRGFARLFPGRDLWAARTGTPARPPQPRGKSPGRPKGYHPPPRPDYPVVIKRRAQA
jgi:hypothetical protein